MGKSSQAVRGNDGKVSYYYAPLQNEHARLSPRKFIPSEELLIAGLDGRPMSDFDDIVDGISNSVRALYAATNGDQEQEEEEADGCCGDEEEAEEAVAMGEDDRIDTAEKFRAYYRAMRPGLFPIMISGFKDYDSRPEAAFRVNCFGTTRQSITLKTGLRAEPNAKERRCRRRVRTNIRVSHFNDWLAEAERTAEAEELAV
jgi:hypothetical protein